MNSKEYISPTCDKEMLAIIHALKELHHYLYGNHVKWRTNHRSLRFFLSKSTLRPRQGGQLEFVQGYDFDIEYNKGKRMLELMDYVAFGHASAMQLQKYIQIGLMIFKESMRKLQFLDCIRLMC